VKPESEMEPGENADASAEEIVEPEWERQKRRLRRRELIITVIGAAMLLFGMVISFFTSARR